MSRDHERLIELLMIVLVVLLLSLARPNAEPENAPATSSSPTLWLISRIPCALESGGFALPKRILVR